MSVGVWQLLTYSERVGDDLKQNKKIIHTGNVVIYWARTKGSYDGTLNG